MFVVLLAHRVLVAVQAIDKFILLVAQSDTDVVVATTIRDCT